MHYGLQVPDANISGTQEVTSPYDGSAVATVETIDLTGAEQALTIAHRLFEDRSSWLPTGERVAILERTAAIMRDRFEELVRRVKS